MNICNLENIEKSYGDKILLKNVTLGIDSTDKIGVIGVNGTGKSTLLGIAAGTVEADAGQVICGKQIRISYLSQNPVFDEERSVLENVTERISGQEEHWDTEGEAKAVLARFGIADPDCRPGILSGGQRKRAALAAAILTPCDLLILDEPTNHLDITHQLQLMRMVKNLNVTIISAIHDLNIAAMFCDRIYVLKNGEIAAHGKTEDVLTRELISDIYKVEVEIVKDHKGQMHILFL